LKVILSTLRNIDSFYRSKKYQKISKPKAAASRLGLHQQLAANQNVEHSFQNGNFENLITGTGKRRRNTVQLSKNFAPKEFVEL
jgi:hypothetical protein